MSRPLRRERRGGGPRAAPSRAGALTGRPAGGRRLGSLVALAALFCGPAVVAAGGASETEAPRGESAADAYLRGYVEAWLRYRHDLGPDEVRVLVHDGRVTLDWSLGSPRVAAISAEVRDLEGVSGVEVRIAGEPPPERPRGRWRSWREWLFPADGRRFVPFPQGDVFLDPLADPKQPRFHTTLQRYDTEFGDFDIGSVGFGETFGLLRRPGATEGDGWQVGINGAVFAIFNLDVQSNDLLNADYYVGFPFSWRRGRLSGRVRPFHLSSHLGDEFLLNPQPGPPVERVNLSYEAVEVLGAWERSGVRVYGGGVRIVRAAIPVGRDRAQVGIEYRAPVPAGRGWQLVAGIDVEAWDETGWDRDLSVKVGLRLHGRRRGARALTPLLEYYDGHVPHGQFHPLVVRYYGIGIAYSM